MEPQEVARDVVTDTVFALRGFRRSSGPFDTARLDSDAASVAGYQLIRNVLAIWRSETARFELLVDARRSDLLDAWEVMHAAVRSTELRARCGALTWQAVAALTPPALREYLRIKYGIAPAPAAATSGT